MWVCILNDRINRNVSGSNIEINIKCYKKYVIMIVRCLCVENIEGNDWNNGDCVKCYGWYL